MTKRALNLDLLREIRKTSSRFISILLLVVIAVGFLFGLRMAAPDMEASMDSYLDNQRLMDVHILSTLGLTDEDVAAVQEVEGTQVAEGAYTADALASGGSGQDTLTVKVISTDGADSLNVPALTAGRLPEGENECLVEKSLLTALGIEIGDTITLNTGTGTYEGALKETTFTIVGSGESPLYVSLSRGTSTLGNGTVSSIITVASCAFDLDYYTDLYILVSGAEKLNAYSDEYEDCIEAYMERLEAIQGEREQARAAQLRQDARQELDDGWQEYYDAEAEAETELADARQELTDARQELDDGWQEYYDGQQEIADAQKQVEDGEKELSDAAQTLNDSEKSYSDGAASYQEGESQYADGLSQYQSGYQAYQEALSAFQAQQASYEDGLAQYEAGEAAYQDGLAQYEAGEEQYASGLAQYEAGEEQYAQGLAAYQDGLAQYEAGKAALDARRQQLLAMGYSEEAVDAMLADAQAQLDQTKAQLDAEKAALDASRAQLEETKAILDASRAQLDETKATLEASRAQLDETKATLDAAAAALADGQAQLDENGAILEASKAQLNSFRAQLDSAQQELADARTLLDSGWQDYYDGQQELDDARQQITDGEQELADAYTELIDGEQSYEDGLAEYNDAKAEADQELADARAELENGQEEIDSISDAQWYILDRTANTGFASYQQDAARMGNLAMLFPTVFFLVAALVCLTGMTRMVEEQRVQIGGLKALGYSKPDIARKYVGYGLLASLIGSGIGLIFGGIGIPWVIVSCWKVMYNYPGVVLTFSWPTALVCVGAAVFCCTVAVLVAALTALRSTPAALMRPKAPEPGKRVWLEYLPFLWKRMSFTKKVTARNLFRYQKRFWMTVIGIAGCTALMVTGFGLRDSIMDVLDLQFEDISVYSAIAYLNEDADESETAAIYAELDGEDGPEQYALVYLTTVSLESSSYSLDGNMLVVEEPEDLEGFWHFRDRKTQEPVSMSNDGALISEKTADLLGVGVGDTVTIVAGDDRGTVTISGIVENYVQHYIFFTEDYYEAVFGKYAESNEILMTYDESADLESLGGKLLELDAVSGIYYLSDSMDTIRNQLNGVYPAVIIIIAAAAALAFVVLYNLSSINITERTRELATLRVLGFRDKEMRDYVFRENLVLTVIGVILGVILGKYFHAYLITTVEVELVMFGRSAHILSYVLAVVLTLFFALLVNLVAGRKLSRIDMVESLKTVE